MRIKILGGMILLFTQGGAAMADAVQSKAWCVGRHHFEVSADMEPEEQYSVVGTMIVDRLGPGGAADLDRTVYARIAALRAGTMGADGAPIVFRDAVQHGDVRIVSHTVDSSLLGIAFEEWTEEAYEATDGVLFGVTRIMFPENAAVARAEILTLARALFPRSDGQPARNESANRGFAEEGVVCLPGAGARMPPTAEAHGITFVPADGTRPVGLRIEVVYRAADSPTLEVSDALPQGFGTQALRLGDLGGRIFETNTDESGVFWLSVSQMTKPMKAYASF